MWRFLKRGLLCICQTGIKEHENKTTPYPTTQNFLFKITPVNKTLKPRNKTSHTKLTPNLAAGEWSFCFLCVPR